MDSLSSYPALKPPRGEEPIMYRGEIRDGNGILGTERYIIQCSVLTLQGYLVIRQYAES